MYCIRVIKRIAVKGFDSADVMSLVTVAIEDSLEFMPVAAPDDIVDKPVDGWPWQLELVWVTGIKGHGRNVQYLIKCKLCVSCVDGAPSPTRLPIALPCTSVA